MSFPISFPSKSQDFVTLSSHPDFYLLEFNSPPDNRFTIPFISAYLDALDYLRTKAVDSPKVLVTTSKVAKFFSNGLDYKAAISTPNFFPEYYMKLMRTILEFPWPTVALVNGHAFAAGFMVAVCHDYRIMNPEKGFLCMNEVAFGARLTPAMMSLFRVKFGAQLAQTIALTAHRYPGKEALAKGLVDGLGGMEETEKFIRENKIAQYAKSPAYGMIRRELLKEIISDTLTHEEDMKKIGEYELASEEYYQKREKELDSKLAKL